MKHYLILLFLITSFGADAQMTIIRTQDTAYIVENAMYLSRPHFKGSVTEYVQNNMRYPEEAKKQNITGRVWVSFTIDTTGKAYDIKVIGKYNALLEEEALRLAKEMPLWRPAIDSVTQRPIAKATGFTVTFE
ncbi:MAG: TonB family protein [Chitinophagales bacterium]|nr:TonB family protein [Chitinophagaceae bacterium]MCB9063558.1 TonB family protein [Chitinophagales bacterium]